MKPPSPASVPKAEPEGEGRRGPGAAGRGWGRRGGRSGGFLPRGLIQWLHSYAESTGASHWASGFSPWKGLAVFLFFGFFWFSGLFVFPCLPPPALRRQLLSFRKGKRRRGETASLGRRESSLPPPPPPYPTFPNPGRARSTARGSSGMGGGGGGGGGEDGEWGARARRPNAGPERRGWGRGAGGSWRRRTTGSLSPAPPWIAGPGKRGLKPQPRVPGGGSLVSQSSSSTFPMVTVMDGDRAGPKNGSPPPTTTTTTAHFPREILSLMLQNPPAMSRATSSPIDRGREGRSHGRTPRMAPPRAKGGLGRRGGAEAGWGGDATPGTTGL